MTKNTASQVIGAQILSASDGSAFTGSVTCSVTGDGGTQATGSVGSGACTHEGNGYHTYAPAQAETNYNLIAFTFTGTGAIPVTVQVFTTAQPKGTTTLATPTNITAGTITTVTTLTNAPSDSSGVTTLLSRLSATRAGYLDNLSAGAVALEAGLQSLITTVSGLAAAAATAVWANGTRLLTAGTNIVLVKGTGVTGFNDLDAAGVRSAVGLASANLDTQIAALPTDADVNAQVDAALADYDVPTNAELAAEIDAVQADIAGVQATADAIETDTQNLQSRVPTALVSGKMDASVGAYQSGLAPLQPTTAGRTLDVTATGAAGIDWSNVENPTSVVGLTGTTLDSDQVVASVTGAVGSVTGNVGGNVGGTVNGLTATAQGHVRSAVGLTTANLDTQLADLPTNAELSAETDAVQADVAGVQATADAVELDTQDLQSRVPSALVSGRLIADIRAINGAVVGGDGTEGTPWGPA